MHSLHLRGAVHSFMNVRSRNKWMRFHRDFEWPDFNNPKYMGDLKLFMDRFLKDIHNGWEMTPASGWESPTPTISTIRWTVPRPSIPWTGRSTPGSISTRVRAL